VRGYSAKKRAGATNDDDTLGTAKDDDTIVLAIDIHFAWLRASADAPQFV